jgi:hypothetical protein
MLLRLNNITLCLACLGFFSCREDFPAFELVEQEPKIVIHFSLDNTSESFDIGSAFSDNQGWNLQLKTLKFYISDVDLISANGRVQPLTDVELVNFDDDQDGQINPFRQGYDYIIPKDNYSKFRFSLGLPSLVNQTDPTLLSKDNPLSTNSGMYWDWATMYVFIMLEAGIDTNSDLIYDANIAFHTGLDTLFRPENTYPITFDLPAFAKDTIHVSIDWNELFPTGGENEIDLGEVPFFHANVDNEALEMSRRFTENFIGSITVKTND